MKLKTFLRPEAEIDIEEAANWYENQLKNLGSKFLDEILITLDTISQNPNMYPIVYRNTHRAIIQRFPFGIYYQTKDKFILVFAVMHASRHPKKWQRRAISNK